MPVREVNRSALPKRTKIEVTIGIHAAEAGSSHGDGMTIGDIGSIHEFGAPSAGIPQRSFIRGWYDERQAFIADTLRTQLRAVIAGKRPIEQAAERIALAFEGDVKRRIAQNIPPPLAPATIARKGSSVALIDTGQLRNAIRGQVKVG